MVVMVAALRATRAPICTVEAEVALGRLSSAPAIVIVLSGLRKSWLRMARKVLRVRSLCCE